MRPDIDADSAHGVLGVLLWLFQLATVVAFCLVLAGAVYTLVA